MRGSLSYVVLLVGLFSLSACTTVDKYATARFYEVYTAEGISFCYFKPRFNDCAESRSLDVKISDDNDKLALAKYINRNNAVTYFGFTRGDYQAQTQPLRDFLVWSKNKDAREQHITIKRVAGNTAGYLFENKETEYKFDFIHTRADIPMLVLHINDSESHYGMTVEEVKNLVDMLDAWQENRFSGKKLT